MPAPTIRPAADPLADIDRESGGADTFMERQDRADLPGERSDQPRSGQGDDDIDDARDGLLDADLDVGRGLGPDDDDTIDETERAGDDSIR